MYTLFDVTHQKAKKLFLSPSQIELLDEQVLKLRTEWPAWLKEKMKRRPAWARREFTMRLAGPERHPFPEFPAWVQRANFKDQCEKIKMHTLAQLGDFSTFLCNTTALQG